MDDRLIFFGTAAFSVPTLGALIEANFPVVAVVTKPDAPQGRGREVKPPEVKLLAERAGIPVLQPDTLNEDFIKRIQELRPTAGVLVAYGKIVPQGIISLFPKGIINIHASLLPKYRGSSPIEAAILNGDNVTGVSLMQIDASMDTGPVYATAEYPLNGRETRPQLYNKLAGVGAKTLSQYLPSILSGDLSPRPQDEDQVSKVRLIKKGDGIIDWVKPASLLEREVRAFLGWPGSRTQLFNTDVTVTAAHLQADLGSALLVDDYDDSNPNDNQTGAVVRLDTGELAVICGNGSLLLIDRLKPAGKKEMTGAEFLRGHHQ
jgi:methionyl-tRNA formyltransferase